MASTIQEIKLSGFAGYLSLLETVDSYRRIYEENRHHVYAIAFWMTDSEPDAEDLTANVFRRAFSMSSTPSPAAIDRALINELRQLSPLGTLTLDCPVATEVAAVRRNVLRPDLERAVVQLPPTERLVFLLHDVEGYDFARIAQLVGVSLDEARSGLHQARLRMRELLAGVRQ